MKVSRQYKILLFTILISVSFFNPLGMISEQVTKLIYYLICLYGLYNGISYGFSTKDIEYPRVMYWILIVGLCVSVLMPTLYQQQSFIITAQATFPYFISYLYFFILLKNRMPIDEVEKAMVVVGIITMIVFSVNLLTAPNYFFGESSDTADISRGIVRIRVPMQYIIFSFFYGISRWIKQKEKKYAVLVLLSSLFIVLSVTRQYIAFSFALGLLFLLDNVSFIKKVVVSLAFFFCLYYIVPELSIYKILSETTKEQRLNTETEDDIRVRAYNFFTNEAQTNNTTKVLGNGVPSFGKSEWGSQFEMTTSYNHCHAVDVGWGGFYFYFGLFSTVALIILLIKSIFIKKTQDKRYISYFLAFIFLASFMSGPILFMHQILSLSLALYIVYSDNNKIISTIE